MAKTLTAISVEKLKADPEKRLEVPDERMRGLYLVIQPSGKKSWAVRYRFQGKPQKLTLGSVLELDLAKARQRAWEALQAIEKGEDPAAEKREAKRAELLGVENPDTFGSVARLFIERYAKPNTRSWHETARLIGLRPDRAGEGPDEARPLVTIVDSDAPGPMARWADRDVSSITRRDVIDLLDDIVDRGAGTVANRTLAAIRKLFNWAIERDIIAASPCARVNPPAAETSRDRVLSGDEIRWLWKACHCQGYPFGPLVKLLLVTGQRRDEVAGMTTGELDLGNRLWTIPRHRAKNNRAHDVPLSDAAIEIIEALPRMKSSAGYLFTVTTETPVSGYSRAKENLDEEMLRAAREDAVSRGDDPNDVTLDRWTLHDLRRTVATGMARLGQPAHVVEAILNHKSGTIRGVAAIYNRYSYGEEKRRALEAWARYLTALVTEKPASNVVQMQAVRA